ncbi:hypothetical protein YQE_12431, partial [Dendroctonus ponderosae]
MYSIKEMVRTILYKTMRLNNLGTKSPDYQIKGGSRGGHGGHDRPPCAGVDGCWKSSASKHQFPNPVKNKELCDEWICLTGNKRLLEMTTEKIFSNCRVCSLHFKSEDFGPNRRLKRGVKPSQNLPFGANCAEDNSKFVLSLQTLVSQGLPEDENELLKQIYTMVLTNVKL